MVLCESFFWVDEDRGYMRIEKLSYFEVQMWLVAGFYHPAMLSDSYEVHHHQQTYHKPRCYENGLRNSGPSFKDLQNPY